MTIEDQIRDEILQYGINREAAKISALSSSKRRVTEEKETEIESLDKSVDRNKLIYK